ncbi:guanine nucleotide-binding protein alpha-4 subunit [Laccaria bicolor S238N-H82]|uniref:Guanine nucleotide-binding protein alpha-4 subunit n=1 Tax=Laccaria bicolor (strain S238N-H82 / ATCC MYA-4686) TaxID=486041 RepID=B0DET8_LACBS|nr:guanine nucleotide-binding protein alpha-4 subunit [Laccaria bicolor S238N-H82]EDR07084.1 guanine nucleotide-binding protein alpha-4 subunit [Laccaria bicolor S238N-H82]|eukprot:XP_001882457.1 guanine nucleotide-binding protein alpha-4 subunit [Laccaria bicolor S238N-H82]
MPARTLPNFEDDPLTNAIKPPPDETPEKRHGRLCSSKTRRPSPIQLTRSWNHNAHLRGMGRNRSRFFCLVKLNQVGCYHAILPRTTWDLIRAIELLYEPKARSLNTFRCSYADHSRQTFHTERASWRAVIQLNVVRSIHLIFDAISKAEETSSGSQDFAVDLIASPEFLKLKLRLAPLLQVRETLIRRLTPAGSSETEATLRIGRDMSYSERTKNYMKEVTINSAVQWKGSFGRRDVGRSSFDTDKAMNWEDADDPGRILHACSEDMIRLWEDPMTKNFLDALERVTAPQYIPTDDDILKARLKTLGVTEHRFILSGKNNISRDWRVFDIGGHRSQRAAWVPYFDDTDAIIFLAPISCFDQVLAEDHKVNRLVPHLYVLYLCSGPLTRSLLRKTQSNVSHPLLKNTNLVLFLNKIDILQSKLASGIKIADYVVSYGDRPNDYEHASTYLRRKFSGILKEKSPLPRVFYCHFTTVTDTKSTKYILSNLKDMLMRDNLTKTNLIA